MERLETTITPWGVVASNGNSEQTQATQVSNTQTIEARKADLLPAPPIVSPPIAEDGLRFSNAWLMWFTQLWKWRVGGAISTGNPEDNQIINSFNSVPTIPRNLIEEFDVLKSFLPIPASMDKGLIDELSTLFSFIKSNPIPKDLIERIEIASVFSKQQNIKNSHNDDIETILSFKNQQLPTQYSVKTLVATRSPYHGVWYDMVNRAYETTVSYNLSTRTFTIAPTGASFRIWIDGLLYTKTSESVVHAATEGPWFFYYNTSGVLTASQTVWQILRDVPVFMIYYDAVTTAYIPVEERHHFDRGREWHESQHFSLGTYLKHSTDCILSDYVIGTGTDAAVTWSLTGGTAVDEDINSAISAIADGGPYYRLYKSGAFGVWRWSSSSVPYFSGATYIQYNQLTGGSWQLTELANGNFVNLYLFVIPSPTTTLQVFVVTGQQTFATLALAQAATVSGLDLSGFISQEYVAVYKITMKAQAANSSTGKAEIAAVERLPTNRASIGAGTSPTVHNSLSGRSDADVHPAGSITGFSFTVGTIQTFPTTTATLARTDTGQTFNGVNNWLHTTTIASSFYNNGTTGSVTHTLKVGNNTTSSKTAFYIVQALDSTTQRWDFGMVGDNDFYIVDRTNSKNVMRLISNTGNVVFLNDVTATGYFIGKYKSSDGTAGANLTRIFYAASSSGGAVTVLNTITIKDGLIVSWTQV